MPRALVLALVTILVTAGALAAPAARSASPDVVVSQVFAGGGNAGAPFANDYVELFNRGSTSVDVGGWTVQYASATGTSWQATSLTGSIAPGRRYLVQLASAAAVGAALPTPDATGTTNLAVSGGKVAVVRGSTALACGGSAGSCSAVASVADLVGYGGATDYEGAGPAPAIGNTTAAVRGGEGCTDTDANAGGPRSRGAHAAQLERGGDDVRGRPAADRRRVPGRDRGGRPPVVPLDRARARGRQLRHRDVGHDPRAGLRARDRR